MPRTKQFDQEAVLEKAKQLFWKQGYHATSIQNLVDHLGINRASLYQAFGGKNQLYEAALNSYRQENSAYLIQRLAAFDSIKEGIKQLFLEAILATGDDQEKKGCFVVNCTTEYLPHHPHILSDLLENKTNFQTLIGHQLKLGVEKGAFSKDMKTEEIAAYLYTLFSGIQIISKVENKVEELEKILEVGLRVLE